MTVRELENASLGLISPAPTTDDFGEGLRWKAGPLLGGLDWLLEQLTGTSAIRSLVEPIAGDWVGLSSGEQAWSHAQHASEAVGRNFAAAANPAGWTGEAAEAYSERMQEIGDSFTQYGEGCAAMAEVTGALVELTKSTAEAIAGILGFLGDWLTRAAAQMAVPVVGWAVGAIDGVISSATAIRKINQGIRLIQTVVDTVERFRSVIVVLTRLAYLIKVIAQSISHVNRVRTVAAGDTATATAFGVQP
ncbi:hypothetical protein [Pseudactinotalea sp. Z1748]|uniref:hypothetical protein n=1 Tax=Pseudactinotalea sp. Z1748 TaxID=3413027 RepID=UPI003C79B881